MQNKLKTDQDLERERQRYINWLNSEHVDQKEIEIDSLEKCLDDGIILLKIIESISPGIVDWSKVNNPAVNKFKKLGNCNYVLTLCKELKLPITGVGGRDIVDGNITLLYGVIWLIMRESFIAKHGPKTDEEVVKWANQFLDIGDDEVEKDDLDEFPYIVVLYRGDEGEVFMGDDVEIYDCPFMPENFNRMVLDVFERGDLIEFSIPSQGFRKDLKHGKDQEINGDEGCLVDEIKSGIFEEKNEIKRGLNLGDFGMFEGASEPVKMDKKLVKKENKENDVSILNNTITTPPKEKINVRASELKSTSKSKNFINFSDGEKESKISNKELKPKTWLKKDLEEIEKKSIKFASDDLEEETLIVDESSFKAANYNTVPLMHADEMEDISNNFTLIEENNIEYNIAQDFKSDDIDHLAYETQRTLFPAPNSNDNLSFEEKNSPKIEKEEEEENVILEDKRKEGCSLFEMMNMVNIDEHYKEILNKCMEKNYFSRFKIGQKVSLPFYLKLKQDLKENLRFSFLKINRYFTKKFEKIDEAKEVEVIEEKDDEYFNYDSRLKSFDYKFKKLKNEIKVIESDEEKIKIFEEKSKILLEEENLNLRTRLLLKRLEICLKKDTKNRYPLQKISKIEGLQSNKSYLGHQNNLEIDEKMRNLFYRKVVMMRLSSHNFGINHYRSEKVGILFNQFLEKYDNPIREEISEDMIKKFVEDKIMERSAS